MLPVQKFYKKRFLDVGIEKRSKMWQALCRYYFQMLFSSKDTVMDLAAGYCEFINAISCGKKYAVDLNPDTKKYAGKDVTVIISDAAKVSEKLHNSMDVVFISNFLEHLNTKEEVLEVLQKSYKLLKKNGRVMILQPNIDLVGAKYWDFFDHKVALNGKSVQEALSISGFDNELYIERFLPYTTSGKKFPISDFLIMVYLLIPSGLRPFAGQSFFIGRKS